MTIQYEQDIAAWANEQAGLIHGDRFELLDLEHIAEEIENVSKSEQDELVSRMAMLLARLLKWGYQPERRNSNWKAAIHNQHRAIKRHVIRTPSLKVSPNEPSWGSTLGLTHAKRRPEESA